MDKVLVIVELNFDDDYDKNLADVISVLSPISHMDGVEGTAKLVKGEKVKRILDIFWEGIR